MKSLVVFDLKGTLVNQKGSIVPDFFAVFNYLKRLEASVMLYSISEPWTYDALSKNPQISNLCTRVLLVDRKQLSDIKNLKNLYDKVYVIGDGLKEEIAYAKSSGLKALLVSDGCGLVQVQEFLKELEDE